MRAIASWASPPLLTWSAPAPIMLLFSIEPMVCFSVTCVISCPRTPASSASVLANPNAPRVIWMMPPGAAKAFTPSVSSTMNSQFRFGRELPCARTVPSSVTYFVTAAS